MVESGELAKPAEGLVAAVNANGTYGHWEYRMARSVAKVDEILDEFAGQPVGKKSSRYPPIQNLRKNLRGCRNGFDVQAA
jgi:hypothetical protein